MRKAICLAIILAIIPINTLAYSDFYETIGEAIAVEDGYLLVSGIGLTDGAQDEVLLFIGGAEIYDLRTGFPMDPNNIRQGDSLRVAYDTEGSALEVYVHAGEVGSADFMVVVSGNIWYSDEGCVFVTIDGKYRIILDEDTLLLDSYGYEMSWDEIEPGMEMFVWAAFVTASFPGQVIPDKIVLRQVRG